MPEYKKDSLETVQTAVTVKRHSESDKSLLELTRELRENE